MNKKVLASLILAVLVSFLVTFFVSGFLAEREVASQRERYASKEITFGEILVPVGVPFSYGCTGLCGGVSLDTTNLLKDVAVFYIPSYILVYFILEVITKRRARSALK